MKKRLSISQLTALSFALLPAQSMIASLSPEELPAQIPAVAEKPKSPTSAAPATSERGMISNILELLRITGTQSLPTKPQVQLSYEESELLNLARQGRLYDEETGEVNSEILGKYRRSQLASTLTDVAEQMQKAREAALNDMIKEVLKNTDAFDKAYQQETSSLEQVLRTANAIESANIPALKKIQADSKEHTARFNNLLLTFVQRGFDFTERSKTEREKMDGAIHSAKQTVAALKGSVSPRDVDAARYAVRVIKESPLKPESKKQS